MSSMNKVTIIMGLIGVGSSVLVIAAGAALKAMPW